MTLPTPAQLRDAFGLDTVRHESLSPWARVHRGRTGDGTEVVVKRTAGSQERATAMAEWTRMLDGDGIAVVTPVALDAANPQPVAGSGAGEDEAPDWWVVYPFVPGRSYTGGPGSVEAAGDLLGRIHAAQPAPSLAARLRPYAWPDTERAEVDEDLGTLEQVLAQHGGDGTGAAFDAVRALAERWWGNAFPQLRAADDVEPLPRTGVTSDYKAANLVVPDGGRPVMVDPDNGGVEPRIFDLALALVLFHNECPTAPARLLTPDEWRRFAGAYLQHVRLTARERDLWSPAVDHMLWEEGTWALEDNDADAWADPRQGPQLLDLALAAPERYPLPR